MSSDELNTPAAKLLQSLNDGKPFTSTLDGYSYSEALAILDSITAEIKSKTLGGKGYMDSAEEKGTRIDFEEAKENIFYPYRKPGLDQNGCRVIIYKKTNFDGLRLEQFIEDKIRFFEGLNESARSEFIRQTLVTFNEKQLAELLKKHDSEFKRDTIALQEKLQRIYEQSKSNLE